MKLDHHDLEAIGKSILFRNAPRDVLGRILESARLKSFDRNQNLFFQGEDAKYLFVVLEGWVKLTRNTPAGDEVVVHVYSVGNSFGEAAALNRGAYPVTAVAVTGCRVLKIDAAHVLRLLSTEPELAISLLGATFKHLHELIIQVEEIKALSGVKRLAAFLLALAPVHEGSCAFRLPYDKSLIAARLGIKPESLSRAFARLREQGVLVSRDNVAISDVESLHEFVDDDQQQNFGRMAH